jgi:hypothetical protein
MKNKQKKEKQGKETKFKAIRKEKPSYSRRWIYVAVVIVTLLIPTAILLYLNIGQNFQAKAAIIDQLRIFHPNETFKNEAVRILEKKFERVDYYPEATVELYEKLPSLGYKLIVWRTHSALGVKENVIQTWIAIATSEKYVPGKYSYEIEKGQIAVTKFIQPSSNARYFGITPTFIRERMQEKFSHDTLIILLSCNGLVYIEDAPEHAKAFVLKGAKAVISWSYWVNPVHNDNAGTLLLRLLIEENKTISEAVEEVPPDTSQEKIVSKMRYYPQTPEVGSYRIPNYKMRKNQTTVNLNFFQALILGERKTFQFSASSANDRIKFFSNSLA